MIKLVSDTIDKADIAALVDWLTQDEIPRLTKGDLTVELERKWAAKIGIKYSVYVNSGSSAILLSLAAYLQSGKARNKKVVVPALSWATDVSSPILLGMEPIMCDCNLWDLSCDLGNLENLFIEHGPSCFILVSPLGLVPNMNRIVDLCDRYGVTLFEDVCESMGSRCGDGRYLGTFGFASFFSLYFGHHLSTIEGGFINTNDEDFYHLLLMMRSHGWDRDLPKAKQTEIRAKYGVDDFTALYNFYVPGFNLRATDLQAFIGLRAIDKLDKYSEIRERNYKLYTKGVRKSLCLTETEGNFVSNFAFPVVRTCRAEIVAELVANGIEVRPLIAGNMANKPMWYERYGAAEKYAYPNCRMLDEHGFYVPNHQDLSEEDISRICAIINKYD